MSIWDFVHSRFCPMRDFVQFGILPIQDFAQFKIVYFGIFSMWNLSIWDFVCKCIKSQFELLILLHGAERSLALIKLIMIDGLEQINCFNQYVSSKLLIQMNILIIVAFLSSVPPFSNQSTSQINQVLKKLRW